MDENIEITRDTYNAIAHCFDFLLTPENAANGEIQFLDNFLSKIKKGGRIVDLGCGVGKHSRYCLKKGFRVVGYDISDAMIKNAKDHDPSEHTELLFFKISDMCDFESDLIFDGAIIAFSMMHLTIVQAKKMLENLKKYLSDGAIILIATLQGSGEGYKREMLADDHQIFIKEYMQEEMLDLLDSAGYVHIDFSSGKDEDPKAICEDVLFITAHRR